MRLILAIWVAKILTIVGRLAGKKSSSRPGAAALKIYPNLIRYLSANVKKGIIIVCGTNGKTTTNNLIYNALVCDGYKTICNVSGANMLNGIATLFAQSCSIFGRFNVDYACLEVDEAFAVKLFDYLTPSCMIITNLFRDQLDRYGEIDAAARLLKNAVDKAGGVRLILNGDDPLTVQFGIGRDNSFYFGVNEKFLPQDTETREGRFCVMCGEEMNYNYFHYSQLGDFYCPACGYAKPELNFAAHSVDIENGLEFTVGNDKLCFNHKGFYNIYNALAAYAVISILNVDVSGYIRVLANYLPQLGRMEEFKFNKPVILNLSKNPAGFNQVIAAVCGDTRKKDIIIALNDNPADGTDVSWIWDVDFDKLINGNFNTVTAAGTRLYDIALRLKYAGLRTDRITNDIREAITHALSSDSLVCYVLINYTALFSTHKILTKLKRHYKGAVSAREES